MNQGLSNKYGGTIVVAFFFIFLLLTTATESAHAELMIYPAKGQKPEQQQKDESECHQWAVEQTGFDPSIAQEAPPQEEKQKGRVVKGAAGGALVGLGIGAIAGDAGKGAAIGAGTGAVAGGVKQRQQNVQKEAVAQQAQAEQQAQVDSYNKAKSACLEGKGYTVK